MLISLTQRRSLAKMGKGFTEIEGLFQVGERIFEERDYAVLIGLYGNGQVIYTG